MEDGREMIESIYLSVASRAQGPLPALKMTPVLPRLSLTEASKDVCLLPFTYSGAFPAFLLDQGVLESKEIALFIFVSTGRLT